VVNAECQQKIMRNAAARWGKWEKTVCFWTGLSNQKRNERTHIKVQGAREARVRGGKGSGPREVVCGIVNGLQTDRFPCTLLRLKPKGKKLVISEKKTTGTPAKKKKKTYLT